MDDDSLQLYELKFYLNPHITEKVAGTQLKYNYRNQKLTVELDMNNYPVSNNRFKIISKNNFGFYSSATALLYFNGNKANVSLEVATEANSKLTLDINKWEMSEMAWVQSFKDIQPKKLTYKINDLKPDNYYTVLVNGKTFKRLKSDADGSVMFGYKTSKYLDRLVIVSE